MEEHTCEVREYRGDPNCSLCSGNVLSEECPRCRIGCFAPARFRNPGFDLTDRANGLYNYAEWLCADHYDEVVEFNHRYDTDTLRPWEKEIIEDLETEDDDED